jgi:hypothetical protein
LESVSEADLELIEGSVTGSQEKTSALSTFKVNGFAVPSGNSYQIQSKGSPALTKLNPALESTSPQLSKSTSSPEETFAQAYRAEEKPESPHGNNGVGNGEDPAPPGNPNPNDGPGTGPGNPGNGRPIRP